MALAATKVKVVKLGNAILLEFTVTASGNYAAGGDALDLAPLVGIPGGRQPLHVSIRGKAGFVYEYDLAAKKMMVFVNTAGGVNTALGEHTAVAYVAGITGDTIRGFALFAA